MFNAFYFYKTGARGGAVGSGRKIASSIPDGVIRVFHFHNLSGRIMALGLTQLLTEISTRNVSWG